MIVDESSNSHRLSSTIKDSHRHATKRSWESMRVGSGSCVISRNARAIASRDVNKFCCARVPVLLPSSFRTCDWHSSVHTEEMGLSDELVYCFYRLSTRLTEVEQGSQINSCVVKIYLRMLIFTHQIYQQSCNYTDSRQILKEIELFWFEILLEYPQVLKPEQSKPGTVRDSNQKKNAVCTLVERPVKSTSFREQLFNDSLQHLGTRLTRKVRPRMSRSAGN